MLITNEIFICQFNKVNLEFTVERVGLEIMNLGLGSMVNIKTKGMGEII